MKMVKSLFLSDRFFLAFGLGVICFLAGFAIDPFFYVGFGIIGLSLLACLADAILLFRKKHNLRVKREVDSVASLHDPFHVLIKLKNVSGIQLKLLIIDELPFQLRLRDFKIHQKLKAGKVRKVEYNFLPQTRGEYAFGDVNVFSKSLLGLAMRKEVFKFKHSVAVMPSVIQMKQQELLATKNLTFNAGENKNKVLGKSYEFDQLKTYVAGDDPRNINWKATSKQRQLMTNHYEDERSQQVYAIIDKGRNMKMPFNGLTLVDYAINATLAFSNIVLKKHDKTGLICFSEKMDTIVPAEKSPRQLMKIQQALYAETYHYTEPNFELLTLTMNRLVPNRSLLFLYTNFDTLESLERTLPALLVLNRKHKLVVIFFTNTELEDMIEQPAKNVLHIYNQTLARKFMTEKELMVKELTKHGITSLLTAPEKLSANAINKYLELKAIGVA